MFNRLSETCGCQYWVRQRKGLLQVKIFVERPWAATQTTYFNTVHQRTDVCPFSDICIGQKAVSEAETAFPRHGTAVDPAQGTVRTLHNLPTPLFVCFDPTLQ